MNGMALCAGGAGLELGIGLVEPGYRTVCYVEGEIYAAAVLRYRMEDKTLDEAPIWDDLRTFDGKPWCGHVDIVTAGFPCQPWSSAGKQAGTKDERWIWPEIVRIISEVGPQHIFLENVPGIYNWISLSPSRPEEAEKSVDMGGGRRRVEMEFEERQGAAQVLGDLTHLKYNIAGSMFSASGVGAPHIRKRVFIMAESQSGRRTCPENGNSKKERGPGKTRRCDSRIRDVPDSDSRGCEEQNLSVRSRGSHKAPLDIGRSGKDVSHTDSNGWYEVSYQKPGQANRDGRPKWEEIPDPINERLQERGEPEKPTARGETSKGVRHDTPRCNGETWWSVEPGMGRVAHGVANRVDRLRTLGNGVVPLEGATAYLFLRSRLLESKGYDLESEQWDEG